jgi:hypothetical protein
MSESRRKLLKVIASGTGVFALGAALPGRWTKPVVEAVLLPAHAQHSAVAYTLSCVTTQDSVPLPEGSLITNGTTVVTTFTVSPNPGAGVVGSARILCDGSETGTDTPVTDASGQWSRTTAVGTEFGCGVGSTEAIEVTLAGVTETCSWVVLTTAPI